jgi:ribonucleoside-diphosphate reductase alpha chain
MTTSCAFPAPVSREIWEQKYRLKPPVDSALGGGGKLAGDADLEGTFRRVAEAVASAEEGTKARARRAEEFFGAISDFGFLPAGRILAGAGTGREVTLFNCFVMGRIEDDLASIFDNVKEAALTMQQGGGIGHDFSTLRPKGALVRSIGADASGPVAFMDVWDAMCRTIMSAGARRGAMMATMRCDHPDIEAFIEAKSDPARLRNFNLSVLVTDAFMEAVEHDASWPLVFGGKTYREVPARDLWERLMRATYDYAEPGVIFIDRVNRQNNLGYLEEIHATNPCGEQPLPPYGACLLGSINLTRFVRRPFTGEAGLDIAALKERVRVAVRFLDNVIDISGYPLKAQRREAKLKRRIGLGLTGLADALIMLGVRYGSDKAAALAGEWMCVISRAAYLTSTEIAREKGAFPLFDRDRYLERPHIAALDADVRKEIARNGIRNGCLTSIAPTGTISLFAGNVSSGIEPVFDFRVRRRILGTSGEAHEDVLEDFAYAEYVRKGGNAASLPPQFVTAAELSPLEHLRMQAAVQAHVDSSISKTINCPEGITFDAFMSVYREAYGLGLKGCTTYRPNPVTGAVLSPVESPKPAGPVTAEAVPQPLSPAAPPDQLSRPVSGDVVYLSRPLERAPVLSGATYKLRWPDSDHAIYITINDIDVESSEPGHPARKRPFEIFINTRNLEHYAWTVALTRMISAVFRRGGDVSFVAEELKAVFDPQGGRFIGGRYVPSLLAAIGDVIETHLRNIGFLSPATEDASAASNLPPPEDARKVAGGRVCQRCGHATLTRREGCWVCSTCGFSRCG